MDDITLHREGHLIFYQALLYVVLQKQVDLRKHVSEDRSEDDSSTKAGEAGDYKATAGTFREVHLQIQQSLLETFFFRFRLL